MVSNNYPAASIAKSSYASRIVNSKPCSDLLSLQKIPLGGIEVVSLHARIGYQIGFVLALRAGSLWDVRDGLRELRRLSVSRGLGTSAVGYRQAGEPTYKHLLVGHAGRSHGRQGRLLADLRHGCEINSSRVTVVVRRRMRSASVMRKPRRAARLYMPFQQELSPRRGTRQVISIQTARRPHRGPGLGLERLR